MTIIIILTILIVLIRILMTLEIKLDLKNIKINIQENRKRIVNKDSKITLKIYLLNKIKILEIDLKKINLNSEKFKNRITKLRKNKSKFEFNLNAIDIIRREKFLIEKMNLNFYVGTENAAITAIIVGVISSIIANVLKNKCEDYSAQEFQVVPIYENTNFLKIEFDGIFSIKIANIIDIAKLLIKKGRVKEYDRTSNRRSYVYSNE